MSNDAVFRPALTPAPTAASERWIHVVGSKVFVDDRCAEPGWHSHFLGMHGDVACWGVDVPAGEDPAYGAEVDLRALFGRVSDTEWAIAGRAVQIVEWGRTHRFCGRCGEPTRHADDDRAFECPSCSLIAFPRLSPAIITLVTRGEGDEEEALLARGANFGVPMYSCLAGFVEPGESLEQAVAREVEEEVGVEIGSVSYVASQPWPFPHSLMLGFRARWVSGDIVPDPVEIADAQWFGRGDLPMIPPHISIARRLIDDWVLQRA
ncbi:MAG: NAD(+) diphosphatase [Ilumatobacteraceae bacterium]